MGNFALQAHPLVDDVELTVQRENSLVTDTFKVRPPRSIRLFDLFIKYSITSFHIAQDLDQPQRTSPTLHHIEPTTVYLPTRQTESTSTAIRIRFRHTSNPLPLLRTSNSNPRLITKTPGNILSTSYWMVHHLQILIFQNIYNPACLR